MWHLAHSIPPSPRSRHRLRPCAGLAPQPTALTSSHDLRSITSSYWNARGRSAVTPNSRARLDREAAFGNHGSPPWDESGAVAEHRSPPHARSDAQYLLGIAHMYGDGVGESAEEARRYLRQAARGGHREARVALAHLLVAKEDGMRAGGTVGRLVGRRGAHACLAHARAGSSGGGQRLAKRARTPGRPLRSPAPRPVCDLLRRQGCRCRWHWHILWGCGGSSDARSPACLLPRSPVYCWRPCTLPIVGRTSTTAAPLTLVPSTRVPCY